MQVSNEIRANGALAVTTAVGLLASVGLTAATAEVYEAVVENDGVAAFDQPVLDEAISLRSPRLDDAVTAFTNIGGTVGMTIVAVFLIAALTLLWRTRTPLVLMLIGAAGALAMAGTGKQLVGRVRPPLSEAVPPYMHSPSFPSGHALNATVITGLAVYLFLCRVDRLSARAATVAVGVLFVVAMGLSRVFLGHHWLTDVIAGWMLGLAWVAVVVTAHRAYRTVRGSLEDRVEDHGA